MLGLRELNGSRGGELQYMGAGEGSSVIRSTAGGVQYRGYGVGSKVYGSRGGLFSVRE